MSQYVDVLVPIDDVASHYQRMLTGFDQARSGLRSAAGAGRLPGRGSRTTEERLAAGASAYARAAHRLAQAVDPVALAGRGRVEWEAAASVVKHGDVYPYLLDEVNGVLLRYRCMVAGFHRARLGVWSSAASGRLPDDLAAAADRRLAKAAFSYHRAAYRLCDALQDVWDPAPDV